MSGAVITKIWKNGRCVPPNDWVVSPRGPNFTGHCWFYRCLQSLQLLTVTVGKALESAQMDHFCEHLHTQLWAVKLSTLAGDISLKAAPYRPFFQIFVMTAPNTQKVTIMLHSLLPIQISVLWFSQGVKFKLRRSIIFVYSL